MIKIGSVELDETIVPSHLVAARSHALAHGDRSAVDVAESELLAAAAQQLLFRLAQTTGKHFEFRGVTQRQVPADVRKGLAGLDLDDRRELVTLMIAKTRSWGNKGVRNV